MNTDLSIVKYCKLCGNLGYIYTGENTVKECICIPIKRRHQMIGNLCLVDLEKIEPKTEEQRKCLNEIKKNPERGFFFYGTIRKGKTYIMAGLFNYLYNKKKKVKWFSDYDLKNYFRDVELGHRDNNLIEKIKRNEYDFIFIDDLAKAKTTEFVLQSYYHLFDLMLLYDVKLVANSFFSLEELAEVYGISIVRRIEDLVDKVFKL